MKRALCVRTKDDGKQTLSRFFLFSDYDKIFECLLLEPPWKNNEHNISCLPAGEYWLAPRESSKFGHHLEITGTGVEDRGPVLIHAGNTIKDTHGCQLAGRSYQDINGDKTLDVVQSRVTMDILVQFVTEKIPYEIISI